METFATLHAQIDEDPVEELMRRLRLWSMVPGVEDAHIVPANTIHRALVELIDQRCSRDHPKAHEQFERYYDL